MTLRPNDIKFATIFQKTLDQAITFDLLTSWMDKNSGQVKYDGGNEIKIPTLSTDGLANYGRTNNTGYVSGKVDLNYKTYTMTQDRGRSFEIDRHDVDESNYIATVGNVMGVFQREKVVPEIDAYRLSKCIKTAMDVPSKTNVKYSVTLTKDNVISELKNAIKTIRETGYMGRLIIHGTFDFKLALEEAMLGKLTTTTWSINGVNTTVPAFDNCPIIDTPSQYMVSAIQLYDGTTGGQEAGGFVKGSSAKDCNFVVIAENAPVAVTKQDKVRTFTPDENQNADAWKTDYRRYHDLFLLESRKKLIFANMLSEE